MSGQLLKLITCGEPTENTGRTYPMELLDQVEEMFQAWDGKLLVDSNIDDMHIDLSRVTHVITEVVRDGNTMYVRLEDGPSKLPIPKNILSISPMGTGIVDKDGVVTDFKLTKISVIPATYVVT